MAASRILKSYWPFSGSMCHRVELDRSGVLVRFGHHRHHVFQVHEVGWRAGWRFRAQNEEGFPVDDHLRGQAALLQMGNGGIRGSGLRIRRGDCQGADHGAAGSNRKYHGVAPLAIPAGHNARRTVTEAQAGRNAERIDLARISILPSCHRPVATARGKALLFLWMSDVVHTATINRYHLCGDEA